MSELTFPYRRSIIRDAEGQSRPWPARSGQPDSPSAGEPEVAPGWRTVGGRAELATSVHDSTADLAETRNRLVRLAYRFTWDHDEAEDVAHEALVTAQERASSLRDQRSWWSWVCRIVVRKCQERGRRRGTWRRHAPVYASQAPRPDQPKDVVQVAESTSEVAELLRRLPPRQYEVVVLRHLEGMGYADIAETLGISVTTARVHARAGRESLRKLMARAARE